MNLLKQKYDSGSPSLASIWQRLAPIYNGKLGVVNTGNRDVTGAMSVGGHDTLRSEGTVLMAG